MADRNAPAVERALGRASSALIEADPSTEVRFSESSADSGPSPVRREVRDEVRAGHLFEEVPFVDLSEEE